MKISVIIPCYNAQAYLRACLDSVLAQSMDDFEAILIDDGSKDCTREIAEEYVKKDGRVRLICQENAGVSAARNAGLQLAQGEWVTYVDADDLIVPDAFETLLAYTDAQVDMVVSLHEVFGEGIPPRTVYPDSRWMDYSGERRRHAAVLRLIEGDSVLNVMCNKLIRRTLIEREGLRLVKGLRIAEDALFNLETVLCARGIAFCAQRTYRYRIHAASATQTLTQSAFDTHLPWLVAMKEMLCRRGVMGRYYPAYFDSAVLRLYKDGGVGGVVREFAPKAAGLLREIPAGIVLSARGRLLKALCERKLYGWVYPLVYPFQVCRRKGSALVNRLQMRRGFRA